MPSLPSRTGSKSGNASVVSQSGEHRARAIAANFQPVQGGLSRGTEGRKTVTVLFADLVAFTQLAGQLDPEALRGLMSEFFARAAAVVERHGGIVEKFIGDEVMALFGFPLVREDDALRAVRAAVALRRCVAEFDQEVDVQLAVRIGVNTGEVMTGDPSLGHSFVSGEPIALGKRLEQAAAPGEILVGQRTHLLVAHAVRTSEIGPLALKGMSDEVSAHRLDAVDPNATAIPRRGDTPFAGHAREFDWLHARYGLVAGGEGAQMVTLLGEPGIGKSRLARELLTAVREQATALVGRCPPHGEGVTFSPVREIFEAAGRGEAELEGSSYEVFAAVRRLLEELSERRPVVAVFDDIHWAEETLLDLLEYLALRLGGAPVLVLCLARPDLLERRPQWIRDPNSSLALDPLTESESLVLVEALGAPEPQRAQIAQMAEGNPLFIEQLALFASENEASVTLVDSIRGVLHARLDRLDPEPRGVLERAAVIGRSFSMEAVLDMVAPGEREAAAARLFELARHDLIRPESTLPEGFRFKHALVRDAVYEAMPKSLRADLHLIAAARTESGNDADPHTGYHLERAYQLRGELGRRDLELGRRAGHLLFRAGQDAVGRSDVPAAIALLERARALLPEDDRELSPALTALGDAQVKAGNMTTAEQVLDEAIAVAVNLGSRSAELHARVERQFVREFTTRSASAQESVSLAQSAIAELEELGDHLALARAWWLRSSDDLAAGRWLDRAKAIERALTHASQAEAGLAMVGTLAGLLAQALLHGPTPVDEAIARISTLPDEFGLEGALRVAIETALAGLLAMGGQIEDARRLYREGIAITEEFGLRLRRAVQAVVGAQIELLAGDPAGAERELRASSQALDQFGASTSAATHRAMLAEVLCALNRPVEGEAQARVVAAEATEDDLITQVLWRSALARALARRGLVSEARGPAQQALELSAGMQFPFVQVAALTAAAEVDGEESARLLAEARRILRAKGNLVELARIDLLAGDLA
jgi:class 3 adenylate cyclase/tetratricopeptide (TPR) repeat protein